MIEKITSRANSKIKDISALCKSKEARKESGRFVIEGLKVLREAVRNGVEIEKIVVSERFWERYKDDHKMSFLDFEKLNILLVTQEICKKISDNATPQEVFGVCKIPQAKIDINLDTNKIKNILMILDLQDIGNFGTIIRTAAALGIKCIMISSCPDLYSPKVLRATMGVLFNIDIIVVDAFEEIKRLKSKGYKFFATAVTERCKDIRDVEFGEKNVLLVGNEGNGLSKEVIEQCDFAVKIPMASGIDSLNVAIATGILIWQARYKDLDKI